MKEWLIVMTPKLNFLSLNSGSAKDYILQVTSLSLSFIICEIEVNSHTCLVEILWELNDIKHLKSLRQGLTQSEYSSVDTTEVVIVDNAIIIIIIIIVAMVRVSTDDRRA